MASRKYHRAHHSLLPQRIRPARTDSRFSPSSWATEKQTPKPKYANCHARSAPHSFHDDDDGSDDVPSYVIDDSIPRTVPSRIPIRRKPWRNDVTDRYEDVDKRNDRFAVQDKRVRNRTIRFADDVDYGGTDRKGRSTESPADDARSVAYSYDDNVDDEEKEDDEVIKRHAEANSQVEDADDVRNQRRSYPVPTPPRKGAKDGATAARRNKSKLKDFERALDEVVADDDLFLKMVRENRTRLARDTKDWTHEYSLDKKKISSLAQKLMKGDLQHLYADLPPHQRATVEETVSRMREMSLQELIDSIAAVD